MAGFKVIAASAHEVEQGALRAVLPKLRRLRDRIDENMHRFVPRDSGYLASTIVVELNEATGKITAGASADYADEVEHGTSRMPAQPFLRPALYQERGTVW